MNVFHVKAFAARAVGFLIFAALALSEPSPGAADDIIVLKDGRRISGTVISDSITIQTPEGSLTLTNEAITRIEFGAKAGAPSAPPPGAPVGPPLDELALGVPRGTLAWIPPGTFQMGSPYDEIGRDRDEAPQTTVMITRGFWMGRCEITQQEYQRVMGANPSTNTESQDRPVEKISWFEAMEYCARLNQTAQAAGSLPEGHAFRLPTEAEWEYACRAGSSTRFHFGDDKSDFELREYAWYAQNSDSSTHPVGKKKPNAWGLFDMHGNVWEWCLDRWEGALPGGTITNAPTLTKGILRVARGGSWLYESRASRSANRDDYSPSNRCADLGFRIVLAPQGP